MKIDDENNTIYRRNSIPRTTNDIRNHAKISKWKNHAGMEKGYSGVRLSILKVGHESNDSISDSQREGPACFIYNWNDERRDRLSRCLPILKNEK